MDEIAAGFLPAGSGRGSDERATGPVAVSRPALKLHTYAIIASLEAGHPGFVTDRYLDSVHVETTLPALELSLAGLWNREGAGYRVSAEETLRMVGEIQRRLADLELRRSRS